MLWIIIKLAFIFYLTKEKKTVNIHIYFEILCSSFYSIYKCMLLDYVMYYIIKCILGVVCIPMYTDINALYECIIFTHMKCIEF
jgi:hypothetical protein